MDPTIPSSSPSTPPPDNTLLFHLSLPSHPPSPASPTILLLHGLGASHLEWSLVTPHLPTYHLLLPDLPGHARSAHLPPAPIPLQALAVAALIEARAHGRKAHVVGFSMGGFVALELARSRPELVRSVVAMGCAPFAGARLWAARRAGLLATLGSITDAITPAWVRRAGWAAQGLTVPAALAADMAANDGAALSRVVFASLAGVEMSMMEEVRVRTLAVAGGRMDDVAATRRQGEALRRGCGQSRAVVVRAAWHPWLLQFPALCAEGIVAWIEGGELPGAFEGL